ncbi:murein biosynthesis integral membrane protein MurJ [Microbacterium gorillae]|uniref:murein biosynthesis integral membrane protein MurJ n=1 Tax=Microbacterium gorillae TaxID=1231063 RepID=UPI00058D1F32|nr:murein biosynthesis integral membrane protein MurJ [Microbacterium gorillae]
MASIGRSSALIAAGTMASRVLGLVRTMLLVTVLGEHLVGDAFAVANNIPNTIYNLISAGLLTAVFVPQIVKSARHRDGGNAFVSKLFTLSAVVLVIVTVIATIGAPFLVQLYASKFSAGQIALAVAFAYWCIPQVLFYGLFALVGETLNAKNVYGPYTWAPIVNNIVSIGGLVAFLVLFKTPLTDLVDWDAGRIALLGATATAGIVAQFLVLLLFWRRSGLSLRPDFRWRGVGLGNVVKLAGWTFLMVIVAQVAGLVQSQIVSKASGAGENFPAQTIMNNAWLVYVLPYSIIVLSIGTPYFTRISEHAAAGRKEELLKDIDSSIRTLGVFIVLATAVVAAAAVPASRIFTSSPSSAEAASLVLLAYLANLIPVAILFIIQRTFYVYGDTRTPFWFTVLQGSVIIITALAASWFVPLEYLALAVAAGQTLATIIQTVVAIILLRRRIGTLHSRSWLTAYGRFALAGIPAGLAGWGVYLLMGGAGSWIVSSGTGLGAQFSGVAGVLIIGAVCAVVYVAVLALLRAPELTFGINAVRKLVRR